MEESHGLLTDSRNFLFHPFGSLPAEGWGSEGVRCLEEEGSEVKIAVALAEDAATRRDGAAVEADVFYVPANALGSGMKTVATLTLGQEGPGWYESRFRPTDPGVSLVRARSGSQMVSAGHVHNPSTEVAAGQIDDTLLREACQITGGTYLENADTPLALTDTNVARYVELWPGLMMGFLGVFLIDLAIRRWENVLGVVDVFRRKREA